MNFGRFLDEGFDLLGEGYIQNRVNAYLAANNADTKSTVSEVQYIYESHKLKLNNLKENRSKADEEKWTDAEIKSVDAQIVILAAILSDLYHKVLNAN